MAITIIAFSLELLASYLTNYEGVSFAMDAFISFFGIAVYLVCPIILFLSLLSSIKSLRYLYGKEGKGSLVTSLVFSIVGVVMAAPFWISLIVSIILAIIR